MAHLFCQLFSPNTFKSSLPSFFTADIRTTDTSNPSSFPNYLEYEVFTTLTASTCSKPLSSLSDIRPWSTRCFYSLSPPVQSIGTRVSRLTHKAGYIGYLFKAFNCLPSAVKHDLQREVITLGVQYISGYIYHTQIFLCWPTGLLARSASSIHSLCL